MFGKILENSEKYSCELPRYYFSLALNKVKHPFDGQGGKFSTFILLQRASDFALLNESFSSPLPPHALYCFAKYIL